MSTEFAQRGAYQGYPIEQRAQVLAMVAASDSVGAVARDTGIPHQTIRTWIAQQDRYAELRTVKAASLDQRLEQTQSLLLDAIPGKISDATLAQTATAFGIVTDKLQLLRGQPTSINLEVNVEELTVILESAIEAVDGELLTD